MKIQVAGPGCMRCEETLKNVINACAELDFAAEIEPIHDVATFSKMGVMITPAVIIDGKIVKSGVIPSIAELKSIIQNNL